MKCGQFKYAAMLKDSTLLVTDNNCTLLGANRMGTWNERDALAFNAILSNYNKVS